MFDCKYIINNIIYNGTYTTDMFKFENMQGKNVLWSNKWMTVGDSFCLTRDYVSPNIQIYTFQISMMTKLLNWSHLNFSLMIPFWFSDENVHESDSGVMTKNMRAVLAHISSPVRKLNKENIKYVHQDPYWLHAL